MFGVREVEGQVVFGGVEFVERRERVLGVGQTFHGEVVVSQRSHGEEWARSQCGGDLDQIERHSLHVPVGQLLDARVTERRTFGGESRGNVCRECYGGEEESNE